MEKAQVMHWLPVNGSDMYKLTSELLGEGAYAKVQGAVSLQNGKEYAVKLISNHPPEPPGQVPSHTGKPNPMGS
ncbi:hypothetical protein P7K49_016191 [Saguinus oedipus]|uniref:Protein kinase domain-containing protein n=1 Tax=Saguinus oedipus TaxID=9490 RepID=A0ABQ9VBT6_SAGOE|nr:hypothetical protein P7K49_016191 [Saguinus oedipus]